MPSSAISSCSSASAAGVGSASGDRPAIASKSQAVALEVAERLVADDHRCRARRRRARRCTPSRSSRSARRSAALLRTSPRRSGSTSARLVGDRVGEVGHQQRVEPEVRVEVAVVVVLVALGRLLLRACSSPACCSSSVRSSTASAASTTSRVRRWSTASSTAGWKPCSRHDQVGLVERRGLGDAQLEVVRLAPGWVRLVTSQSSPATCSVDPRQRVERGHARRSDPASTPPSELPQPARRTAEAATSGEDAGAGGERQHENDSQRHENRLSNSAVRPRSRSL